ncbi:DMT family transporter [Agarivorans sp.]|uniref:DMT family transporter n=1 Tax=Agarivorans sp. TaxID=1872412 RepID=UPI003D011411
MAWLFLILAGLFEVAWAIGLKYSDGFRNPAASAFTLSCIVISFFLLSLALRSLPLGSAYSIWVGIGAIGSALAGILLFGEHLSLVKLLSLGFIVVGVVGMKLAT